MNVSRTASILLLALAAPSGLARAADRGNLSTPVAEALPRISTGVPHATRDKPQSKLWYARGTWWAWLPVPGGSALWRRGEAGWQRLTDLDGSLQGVTGQADVWAERGLVAACVLDANQLKFVTLRFDERRETYVVQQPTLRRFLPSGPPGSRPTETATISRDDSGLWWIAFDAAGRIWTLSSRDREGRHWNEPVVISGAVHADDIGAAVALPGSVGIVWSDQLHGAVRFRTHRTGQPAPHWQPEETVISGPALADDHLNAVVAADGTLYVASKNSIDRIGEPQLCLHVRRPDGSWESHPYAPRTAVAEPSRPIAILDEGRTRLYLLHTLYRKGAEEPTDPILLLDIDPSRLDCGGPAEMILHADRSLNDATGPKAPVPSGVAPRILASDADGRVYEAVLPRRARL